MSIRNILITKLEEGLSPSELSVLDESAHHAGHAAARPEGETHFRIRVISQRFQGMTLVNRHRLVYDLLSNELRESVHALAVETKTPEENENTT